MMDAMLQGREVGPEDEDGSPQHPTPQLYEQQSPFVKELNKHNGLDCNGVSKIFPAIKLSSKTFNTFFEPKE